MLTPTKILARLVFIIPVLMVSCDENSQENLQFKGTLNLSILSSQMDDLAGRKQQASVATHILLSIEGPSPFTMKKIRVYPFEDTYISEPLALLEGQYQLLDFIVLNEQEEVSYVAPKEGSELEALVDHPLPLNFSISRDEVTYIQPSVLRTSSMQPNEFGYSSFGFEVQETFRAAVIANGAFVEVDLQIWADGTLLAVESLEANTNLVPIPTGYDHYELVVEAPNFKRYHETFRANDLALSDTQPLVIHLIPAFTFRADLTGGQADEYRTVSLFLTSEAILYVDYAGYAPKDTLTGQREIEVELPLMNDESFISVTGDLDKIYEIRDDYQLLFTQLNVRFLTNLKNLNLLGPRMTELSFEEGSPIEQLAIVGPKVDRLDISNLDKLIYLYLVVFPGESDMVRPETISEMLYRSLKDHPRRNGFVSMVFFIPWDRTYMDLIRDEFGWEVRYD